MADITVTTNQNIIDVTTTGGVNVTNTTDTITILPSGTLNITTGITDRLVAGSNQVVLNTNATMTFPNNVIDFGSQTADLKSSSYSELWYRNATASPPAGQGIQTYIWAWENQAGIAVESVSNGYKEWYFNANGTTQFPSYTFPYADGTANQILKTNGAGILSWFSPTDANTTYTIASAATTGGANLNLVGSDSTTDSVAYKGAGATTVTSTDANTVTITSTDTNTTYTQNISSTTGGANLNLVGSDSTTDTVKFASGTGVTVAFTDASTTTVSIGQSVGTGDSPSFAGITGGNITVAVATDNTITTTTGNLVLASATNIIDAATAAFAADSVQSSSFIVGTVAGVGTISSVTTPTTSVTPVSISSTTRNGMKVLLMIVDNVTSARHIVEALLLKQSTTAYLTTYAEMYSSAALATFTADVSAGSLRLIATPISANSTTFTVIRTTIT